MLSAAQLNFISKNTDTNFRARRLADRSKRQGLTMHRKSVYLITSPPNKKLVFIHFSRQYETIFRNYLAAQVKLNHLVMGDQWQIDRSNLFILIPYLGRGFGSPDPSSLQKVIRKLGQINKPSRLGIFNPPRYMADLVELNKPLSRLTLTNLERLTKEMMRLKTVVSLGAGILDPAFSNFTELNGQIYLVDLDNFGSEINLDYEVGFLMADVDVEFRKTLVSCYSNSKKLVFTPCYWIGYISRLATILIDLIRSQRRLNDYELSICQKIESISSYLLKTRW